MSFFFFFKYKSEAEARTIVISELHRIYGFVKKKVFQLILTEIGKKKN